MENLGHVVAVVLGIGFGINVLAGILSLSATYGLSILLVQWGYAAPSEHGEFPLQRARGRARQILGFQLLGSIIAFIAGCVLFVATIAFTSVWVGTILMILMGLEADSEPAPAIVVIFVALTLLICAMLTHLPTQLIAYWYAYRHAAWLRQPRF